MRFQGFDAAYVERLAEGDPSVENHFASYFGSLLYHKLRARLTDPGLIEDARQETLLRVLILLREGGGPKRPERFGAFVNSVCDNVVRELSRMSGRLIPPPEEILEAAEPNLADPTIGIESQLVEFDRKRTIEMVLKGLPERDRKILQAMFLDEVEKSEVCRRYQIDAGYLRILLHRAKARFREAWVQTSKP